MHDEVATHVEECVCSHLSCGDEHVGVHQGGEGPRFDLGPSRELDVLQVPRALQYNQHSHQWKVSKECACGKYVCRENILC